jgi:hypothetical protein
VTHEREREIEEEKRWAVCNPKHHQYSMNIKRTVTPLSRVTAKTRARGTHSLTHLIYTFEEKHTRYTITNLVYYIVSNGANCQILKVTKNHHKYTHNAT